LPFIGATTINVAGEELQIISEILLISGVKFIVNTISSFTDGHGPVGSSVVIVNVTVPAVISPEPGV
jgi:hypothetical protein